MSKLAGEQSCSLILAFLQSYVWLARDSASKGTLGYKVRPKLHVLHHWALGATSLKEVRMNPKAYTCWADEDFVRRICSICSGAGHLGVVKSLMSRYTAAVTEKWLELAAS